MGKKRYLEEKELERKRRTKVFPFPLMSDFVIVIGG